MNATNTPTLSARMEEFLNRSTATIAIETSILLLIGLIAIGGNLLVVISIYRNPSLRTITNYFVLSLSITDILYPVMALPLTLVWSISSRFNFRQNACNYQAIISIGLNEMSVATIVLMAINRFVCVCKPQKYKKFFNKKTSSIILGGIWITSFVTVIFLLQEGNDLVEVKFIPEKITCGYIYNKNNILARVLSNIVLVFGLVLPVCIIFYCYYNVFKKIREHKRNIAPANQNHLGTSVQEIKITWSLFAVLLGYTLTWIPAFLFILVNNMLNSSMKSHVPRQAHMISTYSMVSSSAINPLIYGVMNPAFRKEFAKAVVCK